MLITVLLMSLFDKDTSSANINLFGIVSKNKKKLYGVKGNTEFITSQALNGKPVQGKDRHYEYGLQFG